MMWVTCADRRVHRYCWCMGGVWLNAITGSGAGGRYPARSKRRLRARQRPAPALRLLRLPEAGDPRGGTAARDGRVPRPRSVRLGTRVWRSRVALQPDHSRLPHPGHSGADRCWGGFAGRRALLVWQTRDPPMTCDALRPPPPATAIANKTASKIGPRLGVMLPKSHWQIELPRIQVVRSVCRPENGDKLPRIDRQNRQCQTTWKHHQREQRHPIPGLPQTPRETEKNS